MIALPRRRRPDASKGADVSGRSIEIVDLAALSAQPQAWDDLVARAVAPHPHFSRHVVEAHRAAGLLRDDCAVVTIRTGDRLDAILPFRSGLDLTGFGTAVAQPVLSPFMPSSAPLVAGGSFDETLAILIAGLGEASGGRAWRWPLLSISGAVGQGLLAAMDEAGWTTATVASFERPVLDRRSSHDAFLTDHPHKSRLKDLRRRQRRLSEAGTLDIVTATGGEALASALEDFLALESAGWKGKAGTAMSCRPGTLALAHALFADVRGPVTVRADTLSLDGRPSR